MSSVDDDLAQIEALHRRDEQAVIDGDRETLASLWSRDGVMLAPGGATLRGAGILAALRAGTDDAGYDVLEYRLDFEEVVVCGDYAFEWGTVSGKSADRKTGAVTASAYKLMRVLVREDGEWKVHRAIWNSPG